MTQFGTPKSPAEAEGWYRYIHICLANEPRNIYDIGVAKVAVMANP